MATTAEKKKELDLSKMIDEHGPDFLRNVLNNHSPTEDTNYAQMTPNSFDSNPLTLDQLSGVDLTRPDANAGIPEELQQQDPNAIPKYLARPQDSTEGQIADQLSPKTPQIDFKDTSKMVGIDDSGGSNNDYDPNDSIQNPSAKIIDPNSATDYLNMSKGRTPAELNQTPELDNIPKPVTQPDQFNQQLEDARNQDKQHQLLFGLLKAAQMGGSAAGGSKADTSYADTELAKGNQNVTNLKTSMDMKEENQNILDKQQKRDPNSRVSKLYQETLKQLSPNINASGLSAEQVEKAFPQVATAINRQDLIKERKENNIQKSLDRQALFQSKKDAAVDKADEKDKVLLVKAQKDMDEQRATRGTPLGREVMRYNGGLHAKAIIDQYRGHENDMPNSVKKELAVAIATMVSPGLPHEKTIEGMDLKTFEGDVGDAISKVTGTPMPGKAGGFVKFADKMISNQMNTAQKLIKEGQDKQLSVYKNAFHDPKSFDLLHSLYQSKEDVATPVPGSDAANVSLTNASSKLGANYVDMTDPNGKHYSIPKENVQKAIARGLKVK